MSKITVEEIAARAAAATASKAADAASDARVASIKPASASRRGGLKEMLDDPAVKEFSAQVREAREVSRQAMKDTFGVVTRRESADNPVFKDAAKAGSSGAMIVVAPNPLKRG